MDRFVGRPALAWFLALLIAVGLFFLPLVNGLLAGLFAGWSERKPSRAAGHAVVASLILVPLLWFMGLYGVVWRPFAPLGPLACALLCALPMFAAAVLVTTARTTRSALG